MDPITVEGGWRRWVAAAGAGRREILLLGAVVMAVVVLALAAWLRKTPPGIAPPAMSGSFPSPSSTVAASASPAAVIFVHVAGAVKRPGLYRFAVGSRVVDAIDAAGGAKPGADLDAINLAELLVDATKIEVPKVGEAPLPAVAGAGSSPAALVVNLNSADQAALETIPGIGPVTATSILMYRDEVGSFSSVDQLLEVDGIGPATLESLLPYVTI
jgi:competence protein ComEA